MLKLFLHLMQSLVSILHFLYHSGHRIYSAYNSSIHHQISCKIAYVGTRLLLFRVYNCLLQVIKVTLFFLELLKRFATHARFFRGLITSDGKTSFALNVRKCVGKYSCADFL